MKNKKLIIIGLIVICVIGIIFIFGNKIARKIPLVTVPYSKAEILKYLEKNYNEKFSIKQEITLNEETKNIVYIAYPISNETIEFYVLDNYDGGYIGLGGAKGPSRDLHDTYTNALLLRDLSNLKSIYPNISLEEYDVNNQYFTNSIWMGSAFQEIKLSFNSYSDVENLSNKFNEIYTYVKDNLSKYKTAHTKIQIETNGVYAEIGDGIPDLEVVKDNIIRWLVDSYREKGNNEIFDIPVNLKEKHRVKDIGWGNLITKVYVNDKLVDIEHYKKVRIFYDGGCLQTSIGEIVEIIPELKNHLKLVDYNNFKNLNKISSEEEIIFAYEKDSNVYILTEDKNRGWTYIYQYENSDISRIEWDGSYNLTCNDAFKQRLDKYFGITTHYDFKKEILHLNY